MLLLWCPCFEAGPFSSSSICLFPDISDSHISNYFFNFPLVISFVSRDTNILIKQQSNYQDGVACFRDVLYIWNGGASLHIYISTHLWFAGNIFVLHDINLNMHGCCLKILLVKCCHKILPNFVGLGDQSWWQCHNTCNQIPCIMCMSSH